MVLIIGGRAMKEFNFDGFDSVKCILDREAFIDDSIDSDIEDIIRPYRESIAADSE